MVDKQEIEQILKKNFAIQGATRAVTIHDDGTVDIDGDIDPIQRSMSLPSLMLQFGHIKGDFVFSHCGLESLKGSPHTVDGRYNIAASASADLRDGPKIANGDYFVMLCNLESLEGVPSRIGGSFTISRNHLTSLKGGPTEVGRHYECGENHLTSLQGAPAHVLGSFLCNGNKELTSLEGGPTVVDGTYNASTCYGLKTLTGCAKSIGVDLILSGCIGLQNLNGIATEIGEKLVLTYSPTLPLLRLLSINFKSINILKDNRAMLDLSKLILHWKNEYHSGSSKNKAVLACQKALVDHGYAGNAKW